MIIANMAKTCSILRFSVEGSGVGNGVPAGVGVDVCVGVGVSVGSFTVTNESRALMGQPPSHINQT
jgi:hypothetical protein